jgi:hypothetical protein
MTAMSRSSVVCAREETARRLASEMQVEADRFVRTAARLAGLLHAGRVRRRSAWLCRPDASVRPRAADSVSVAKEGGLSC